jgi:UDP-N-acetylmuramate: L-alanyl-gamma-D-glutamyl-meso-diaminopimelate ligase
MKLHLIGICGTGMGAVAGLLKAAGHDVRGSDEHVYPPMSDQLAALGVPVFAGFAAANLDWAPDRVVVGNVCRRDHVEVLAAQQRGLNLTSFPAVLEELFLGARQSVVVAGTHGKTTTTSLLAFLLLDAGRDPSFLVGGVPRNVGRGYRLGAGPAFVIEGDEYDTAFFDKGSKFLHYRPRAAILTSVELDHVDIFADLAAVEAAFARFIALLPEDGLLAVAASSATAVALARAGRAHVETYAAGDRGAAPTWHAEILAATAARTRFAVTRAGRPFATFEVGLAGAYNIENALAAVAMATHLGLSAEQIARGLQRFAGVKRRQEVRGVAAGVTVIDDYAHHPTAVRETLGALRRRTSGRLIAIYEPRSATSRRATFQRPFVEAFAGADEVVVAPLFSPERIPPTERFDPARLAADLAAAGTPARLLPDVAAIVEHVAGAARSGDTVAVFSSGGFGGVHDRLLARLGDTVRPARVEDLPAARALGVPADEDHVGDLLVAISGGEIRGAAAFTLDGEDARLGALVAPGALEAALRDGVAAEARDRGARRLDGRAL